MTLIRCAVIDDEPLARRGLVARLEQASTAAQSYQVVGEAGSAHEASDLLASGLVDLAFLDIQMPGMDGFDLLDRIGNDSMPVVVFVTAYERHALRAFDAGAIDYILKPIDQERFEKALGAASAQVIARRNPPAPVTQGFRQRFLVRERGRIRIVDVRDVTWMEAAGDYVALHVGRSSVLIRSTMSALEAELDPERFVRVHRGAVVQLEAIEELISQENGRYTIILKGGNQCALSASYRDQLARRLGDRL